MPHPQPPTTHPRNHQHPCDQAAWGNGTTYYPQLAKSHGLLQTTDGAQLTTGRHILVHKPDHIPPQLPGPSAAHTERNKRLHPHCAHRSSWPSLLPKQGTLHMSNTLRVGSTHDYLVQESCASQQHGCEYHVRGILDTSRTAMTVYRENGRHNVPRTF
jgi:hypothetical protein